MSDVYLTGLNAFYGTQNPSLFSKPCKLLLLVAILADAANSIGSPSGAHEQDRQPACLHLCLGPRIALVASEGCGSIAHHQIPSNGSELDSFVMTAVG
jgi:hypothetical protein